MKRFVSKNLCDHLHGMQEGIFFQKMIQTAIARDLELRSNSQLRALRFGNPNTLDDTFEIALKIQSC
jgi:hypothetical protein